MASQLKPIDVTLFFAIAALTLFGLIMVTSASSVIAERFWEDPYFFLKHQLVYGGVGGVLAFTVGILLPYKTWRYLALPGLIFALVLLILVFVPGLQVASGGAARWIGVGSLTLQPTEITKLAFIIYLAALLERKGEDVRDFRKSVVPFLIIIGGISALIALQPDIGTLFTIGAIALTMVFASGFRLRHIFLIMLGGAAAFAVLLNTAGYRVARVIAFLNPDLDKQGIGYQVAQSLLAVGSGGWWGLGFGRSRQKYQYLPEPASDSIFAIIAEELGFVRSVLLLAVFGIIAYRGYLIAQQAPDVFSRLVAVGITSWIIIQAFVNIGSIVGVLPLTGIPLPFISYGGSALVTNLLAAGILLNISRFVRSA
jgi:cell division protein FtsW